MLLWLLACTGTETPTSDVDTSDTTSDSADDTGAGGTLPLELGDPPASGVIVASLEFGGDTIVITCPAEGPARGYGLVSASSETLNFNILNHSECTSDSTEFATFAFLNVPLLDSTALPTADGGTPIDVTLEVGGVQNRRTVHEGTGHEWTVTSPDIDPLSATFVGTWDDARLRVWFQDADMAVQ